MECTTGNLPKRSMPVRVIDFYKRLHNSVLEKNIQKNVLEVARHLPRYSLQELSIIKVITSLCNNPQLLSLILQLDFQKKLTFRICRRNDTRWKHLLAVSNELVSRICDSHLLKKSILEHLWPVCYNILLWRSVYAPDIEAAFLHYFYWTDQGKIDTTRTAKQIIGNENVPVRNRFILASKVCLEAELLEVWLEMEGEQFEFFSTLNRVTSPLPLLWVRLLERMYDNISVYVHDALVCAVQNGYLEAVKYIFYILFSKDRRPHLAKYHIQKLILKFNYHLYFEEDEKDIGYLLFFEMSERQQEIYFKLSVPFVLSLLLCSKEYELCRTSLETRLLTNTTEAFLLYLGIIFLQYNFDISGDDRCGRLFMDVWRMLPPSMRNSLTKSVLGVKFAPQLIRDHFPLVLENDVSNTVTCTSLGQNDFNQGKWEFLQFLVEEEILGTDSFFTNHKHVILHVLEKESNEAAWNRFVSFILYVKRKNSEQNLLKRMTMKH